MLKFSLLMSKKTLLLALTLILAFEVDKFGNETVALPSLGVPPSKRMGNVYPPSVLKKMSTALQFTPFPLVPATSQEMGN